MEVVEIDTEALVSVSCGCGVGVRVTFDVCAGVTALSLVCSIWI